MCIRDSSKSPAIFDTAKLNYINGEYLRRLSPEDFYEKALPWMKKAVDLSRIDAKLLASVLQSRTEVLCEIPEQIDFVSVLPEYDLSLYLSLIHISLVIELPKEDRDCVLHSVRKGPNP